MPEKIIKKSKRGGQKPRLPEELRRIPCTFRINPKTLQTLKEAGENISDLCNAYLTQKAIYIRQRKYN